MFTITEVLDGNIYRVVADSEIAQAAQTTDDSKTDGVSFDDVFNSVSSGTDSTQDAVIEESVSDDEYEDGSIYEVLSYYSDLVTEAESSSEDSDTVIYEEGNVYQVSSDESVDAGYTEELTDLDAVFANVSASTGVDARLIKAVAQAESGLDASAVSSSGALGLMQLMPATCESYGVSDPFDAEQNATGGAQLLSWLLDRYDGDVTLALAAYNAGYGNVDRYGGVPPFTQTQSFINKVLNLYESY